LRGTEPSALRLGIGGIKEARRPACLTMKGKQGSHERHPDLKMGLLWFQVIRQASEMSTLKAILTYSLAFVFFAVPAWLGLSEKWKKRKEYTVYWTLKNMKNPIESHLAKLFLIYAAILSGVCLLISIVIHVDSDDIWKVVVGVPLISFAFAYLQIRRVDRAQ
jgi:hypothetical protein